MFHVIIRRDGREFSRITRFYWTLNVMMTLGCGDIAFQSDLGKRFAMLVVVGDLDGQARFREIFGA